MERSTDQTAGVSIKKIHILTHSLFLFLYKWNQMYSFYQIATSGLYKTQNVFVIYIYM